jgi:type VI secretion system Hcp family effector
MSLCNWSTTYLLKEFTMAEDIFMTITGTRQGQFKGLSTAVPGAIDIQGISFGFSTPETTGTAGGGAGVGKPQASAVSITRMTDAVSAQILTALLTGEILTTVQISSRQAGSTSPTSSQSFMTLTLNNARVTNLQTQNNNGDNAPIEEILIVFEKFLFDVRTTGPTGKVLGENKVAFDFTRNTLG